MVRPLRELGDTENLYLTGEGAEPERRTYYVVDLDKRMPGMTDKITVSRDDLAAETWSP